jgi:hypothetical protein
MPVELIEGWPDPRPMRDAPHNGTRLLVAFSPPRRGYAPWTAVARWVIPAERPGKPLTKLQRQMFDRYGGYWASGWRAERIIRCRALGWWELPTLDNDMPVE